ncbi:hypothetical protein AVEN_263103-1 [Araneus ventricosus]|uniref:Uncharacterized protein n=1 Tax=Araneus ventricosus TaxID=182803 RepID=A0A4Y2TIJ4_ARAVE|nr:hypothetical protein AVEN_263103-1 [Araneus ventricosus]
MSSLKTTIKEIGPADKAETQEYALEYRVNMMVLIRNNMSSLKTTIGRNWVQPTKAETQGNMLLDTRPITDNSSLDASVGWRITERVFMNR